MKSLLVLCLVAVAVYGLPAKKTDYDDSEESFFLFPPRQHKKQVPSVVEVEVGDSDEDSSFPLYFRPLFINPFSFMNFGLSDFFSRPSWFDSLIPKGIPEDAVKNATSSTKVIDGHKITVNETTYENEKNGAVYHFQVIDISPVDKPKIPSTEQNTPDVSTEKEQIDTRTDSAAEEVKTDQNSQDNEIHKEEMLASYELQGDDPSVYESNKYPEQRSRLVDLSADTRVNTLLAENARRGGLFMVPPEVEVFDVPDYDSLSAKYQHQEVLDRQEVIRPQYNQETVRPAELNQQTIRPQYQQTVRPQAVPSQYQQTVRPQYQQAVPSQYQQTIQPQYQQTVRPQYYQQTVRPQYNQQRL